MAHSVAASRSNDSAIWPRWDTDCATKSLGYCYAHEDLATM